MVGQNLSTYRSLELPEAEIQDLDGKYRMKPIAYFDRYQQRIRIETVYGEKYLRWTYGTALGRLMLAAFVKRLWFSRWYGWRMDRPRSRSKIAPFIEKYALDVTEFSRQPDEFANFNEFFFRSLKPEARPADLDPTTVVFPAEGRHLCIPDLSRSDGLLVKGEMFSLESLLADSELAAAYANGSMLVSRLCPVDYHRFHFPVAGHAGPARLINGPLYSVNPIALCRNIHILASNRRMLTILETETVGRVLLLEIGATCVGSICQTYQEDSDVSKGEEKGYFRFGGSSTITLFEQGRVKFDDDLLSNSESKTELYARVRDRLGTVV